jgi:hypothetical protein
MGNLLIGSGIQNHHVGYYYLNSKNEKFLKFLLLKGSRNEKGIKT